MWKTARRPRIDQCDHHKRVVTTTAGLERSACESCGHVIMRFAHDNFLGHELVTEPEPQAN